MARELAGCWCASVLDGFLHICAAFSPHLPSASLQSVQRVRLALKHPSEKQARVGVEYCDASAADKASRWCAHPAAARPLCHCPDFAFFGTSVSPRLVSTPRSELSAPLNVPGVTAPTER